MPQLDILSYMSQLLWLVVILGTFYILVIRHIAPELKKVRRLRTLLTLTEQPFEPNQETQVLTETLTQQKTLLATSNELTQHMTQKAIQTKHQKELKSFNQTYLNFLSQLLLKKYHG